MVHSGSLFYTCKLTAYILICFTLTACGRKSQIEYDAAQARVDVLELHEQVQKAEAEIIAVGSLGRYSVTQPSHVVELKAILENLRRDINNLRAEKETLRTKIEAQKDEIDTYRAKYR